MVMIVSVRSVIIDENTKNYCEKNRQVTFAQCIEQYGGYAPEEGACKKYANPGGEEYLKCLGTTYYDLKECFGHCPNHPLRPNIENHFEQYKIHYVPRQTQQQTPTDNNGVNVDPATGTTSTSTQLDLGEADSGSTMLNAFSLGAVLTMIAYWLF